MRTAMGRPARAGSLVIQSLLLALSRRRGQFGKIDLRRNKELRFLNYRREARVEAMQPVALVVVAELLDDRSANVVNRLHRFFFHANDVETGGLANRIADSAGVERKNRLLQIVRKRTVGLDGGNLAAGRLRARIVGILFHQFPELRAGAKLADYFGSDFLGFVLRARIGGMSAFKSSLGQFCDILGIRGSPSGGLEADEDLFYFGLLPARLILLIEVLNLVLAHLVVVALISHHGVREIPLYLGLK